MGISCQGHPLFSLLPVEPLSSLWPRRLGLESLPSSCPAAGWQWGRASLSHGRVRLEPTAFWAVKELSKKPASLSFFKKWGWGAGRALCLFLVFSPSTYKLFWTRMLRRWLTYLFPLSVLQTLSHATDTASSSLGSGSHATPLLRGLELTQASPPVPWALGLFLIFHSV